MPRPTSRPKKVSSGSYEIRFRDQFGVERRQRYPTSGEADRALDEARSLVRRGRYIPETRKRQSYGEFAAEWAASRDWKDTNQGWPYVYKRIEPYLGAMALEDIDTLTLEAMQMSLLKTYGRNTVKLTMSQAQSVLKAAYTSRRIEVDPTLGVKAPKVRKGDSDDGKVSPDDVPTRAEALTILNGALPQFRAAIALGINGLRIGEVMAMSADRIHFDTHRLVIDRQLQRVKQDDGTWRNIFTLPKNDKTRTIGLPPAVELELRRHLRDYPPPDGDDLDAEWRGVLFWGGRGAEMRRTYLYESAWRPALVAAGLTPDRFVFHSLRHFAASSMLAEGEPSTRVAGHLGDTVETVERVYAHWLREDRDIPAAVLQRVLAPVEEADAAAVGEE